MQTFDSGIVLVFEQQTIDARGMFVQHVGVLKDILKLNYNQVQTPIVIFRCEWMKQKGNRRNPTYVRDGVGFLTINFQHRLWMSSTPFIFPSQVTQVVFFNDLKKPRWKVVLQKEAHSKRKVVELEDVFITTTMEPGGLSALMKLPPPASTPFLIGYINVFEKNNLLAFAKFLNFKVDFVMFHIS